MNCRRCGHDADMHWYPGCPGVFGVANYEDTEYVTTACRDCLPRRLYVHKIPVAGDGGGTDGMCTMTKDVIIREHSDDHDEH